MEMKNLDLYSIRRKGEACRGDVGRPNAGSVDMRANASESVYNSSSSAKLEVSGSYDLASLSCESLALSL